MCALCGVLGVDDHWTSSIARPDVYSPNVGRIRRRREAAWRLKLANAVLRTRRLELRDWQDGSYVLSTATGRSEIFTSLAHLWAEAEKLGNCTFDPLDPDLLDDLGSAR